jgi:hypothetical protein
VGFIGKRKIESRRKLKILLTIRKKKNKLLQNQYGKQENNKN